MALAEVLLAVLDADALLAGMLEDVLAEADEDVAEEDEADEEDQALLDDQVLDVCECECEVLVDDGGGGGGGGVELGSCFVEDGGGGGGGGVLDGSGSPPPTVQLPHARSLKKPKKVATAGVQSSPPYGQPGHSSTMVTWADLPLSDIVTC